MGGKVINMSQNIFNKICKICGGKCCKCYYIFLTKRELGLLLKLDVKIKYQKKGAGFLMESFKDCKFLDNRTGCKLPGRLKPFDCNLYPLAFIYKNKKLNFYLIKECVYYKKISRSGLREMKACARRGLNAWTEKEKITYSRLIEDYPKKHLLKI